jgi:SEFIR domain-containing protein
MNPKLFISYSWSSEARQAWVLRLATQLREAGVDVILDRWDLKERHDAHAFMERMVSDQIRHWIEALEHRKAA